ncbi:MAG: ATP-dependent dethiobiotin synthetase BioD [Acidimicrobiales bacterium]
MRPDRLVAVLGTATDVGKTWVGAEVLARLRAAGVRVAARKPAQSFAPGDGATDADVLAAATGESPEVVCPPHRWYEVPMAPPMAADALGRPPVRLAELLGELAWPDGVAVGWVETVGGPRSPVAADADSASLAAALRPDLVVLVAGAGLGAVNAVLLSAPSVARPTVVVLNRWDEADDLHRRNRDWLARAGLDVVTGAHDVAARLLR